MPLFRRDMSTGSQGTRRAYIALGSNVGDRLDMIEKACLALDQESGIKVTRTSSLYETEPMYVEDQARFLNGACEIETTLEPMALLDRLQYIENDLGRVKLIDKGPRSIDLDILLYEDEVIDTERLKIPHILMLEREFVLRPLCDIIPDTIPSIGQARVPLAQSLRKLASSLSTPVSTTTSMGENTFSIRALENTRPTHVMSILNTTPDSFSDGGQNSPTDETALRNTVSAHIRAGATIIDIGGQSSRPNAPDVTSEEEIQRVLPAIKIIKSLPEGSNICISIDTYRAKVAEKAIEAGAHIINDISGGLLDANMLPTVSRLGCTVCLMHMRGTPATMTSAENCSYPDGLIPTIAKELLDRVRAAEEAGIRRWRIVLDPGIGFAKTTEQNLEILRSMNELRSWPGLVGLPWLLGSSRKGFIGKITKVKEAKQRTWGTAATVAAAVQGGADIVRVHDVDEMVKVTRMSDAIWRA
ncbi:folic acid synthesis protein [Aureobasidium subglaciale]|nr:folic acid synthesis protein [Aureobasidium subglaciale]KAI5222614.1 folic acid synthesis protein [Aureobasidium subglaciale]KAI5233173.1 folic acid synthesis protein [Aureobasidium subglaciale]KAI5262234.1 folic acid synthesis protein [Aureobasidium subglaciale]